MADPRSTASMTYERAGVLLSRLPVRIDLGLSDAEIAAVEERFGFRFADDHRVFLQAGLPAGPGWPDWRNGDPEDLRGRLDWPREGVLFDVGHGFWWLRLIVGGSLNAYRGGLLIWHEGWDLLGRPDVLQPLIGWTSEYEDWTESWGMPRETFTERIITEARSLLDGPWPPTKGTNENV
ncbi:hypothetical protein [Streptacidiphilus fuscans]|uniref:SMI1/KNR4 family protein n=1 Tax=Streptacidiphilus fuscans TaxID=2789292 RepID=A0A931B6Z5_9ACTN|nr:hypothetical protein [Streptacidiphilus fuscans]MBF9072370.1 hypothetical protein [Streptacidiphilus fuscans]